MFFTWLFLLVLSAAFSAYFQYKSMQHYLPGKGHIFLTPLWIFQKKNFDSTGNTYRKNTLFWVITSNALLFSGGYFFWWS